MNKIGTSRRRKNPLRLITAGWL